MQLEQPKKKERKLSQRMQILNYLLAGGQLTSMDMLTKFGAYDGRKRISELRKKYGYPIRDRRSCNPESGASFNIYYMERDGESAPVNADVTN